MAYGKFNSYLLFLDLLMVKVNLLEVHSILVIYLQKFIGWNECAWGACMIILVCFPKSKVDDKTTTNNLSKQ